MFRKSFVSIFVYIEHRLSNVYGVAFDGVVGTRFSINLAWYLDLIQLGTAQQEARKNKKKYMKKLVRVKVIRCQFSCSLCNKLNCEL